MEHAVTIGDLFMVLGIIAGTGIVITVFVLLLAAIATGWDH